MGKRKWRRGRDGRRWGGLFLIFWGLCFNVPRFIAVEDFCSIGDRKLSPMISLNNSSVYHAPAKVPAGRKVPLHRPSISWQCAQPSTNHNLRQNHNQRKKNGGTNHRNRSRHDLLLRRMLRSQDPEGRGHRIAVGTDHAVLGILHGGGEARGFRGQESGREQPPQHRVRREAHHRTVLLGPSHGRGGEGLPVPDRGGGGARRAEDRRRLAGGVEGASARGDLRDDTRR
jgi:hypothetical protein